MNPAVAAIIDAGLEVIKQVMASIDAAKAGQQVDPTAAMNALSAMQAALAANDAAADAAAAAKP